MGRKKRNKLAFFMERLSFKATQATGTTARLAAGSAPSSTDELKQLVDQDEIERAFLALSVEHRAVLVLTHYVGLPAAEVAGILQIPLGTVYSRLHYGVRAMREALAPDPPTPMPIPEHGR